MATATDEHDNRNAGGEDTKPKERGRRSSGKRQSSSKSLNKNGDEDAKAKERGRRRGSKKSQSSTPGAESAKDDDEDIKAKERERRRGSRKTQSSTAPGAESFEASGSPRSSRSRSGRR